MPASVRLVAATHPEQARTNLNTADQDPNTQNHPDQIGSSHWPAPNTLNRAEQT